MWKSMKINTSVRYVAKTNNTNYHKYIESFCLNELYEHKKDLKNSDATSLTFPSPLLIA